MRRLLACIVLCAWLLVLVAGCGGDVARTTSGQPAPTATAAGPLYDPSVLARLLTTPGITATAPGMGTPMPALLRGVPADPFGDRTVLFRDEFDGARTPLFIGRTEYGTTTSLRDDAFWMEVPDQHWQNITLSELTDLGNGLVTTAVTFVGDGAVGVVARSRTDVAGQFWFYVCWINSRGEAGCHASIGGQWTELWYSDPGAIPLAGTNALALAVVGTNLAFAVNGAIVATVSDATVQRGMWGIFAESYAGTLTAAFESLTIAEY
jgi:hypothetical protein